jgi:hypothetical protein
MSSRFFISTISTHIHPVLPLIAPQHGTRDPFHHTFSGRFTSPSSALAFCPLDLSGGVEAPNAPLEEVPDEVFDEATDEASRRVVVAGGCGFSAATVLRPIGTILFAVFADLLCVPRAMRANIGILM